MVAALAVADRRRLNSVGINVDKMNYPGDMSDSPGGVLYTVHQNSDFEGDAVADR